MKNLKEPQRGGKVFHVRVLSAMGHPGYLQVWSGALVSNIGTWIQMTVVLWYVNTHAPPATSNTWVGLVNLAGFVPVLLLVILAGYVADILDRKRVILFTQAAQGLCALALGICMTLGVANLYVIVAVSFLNGIAFTFGFPAYQSFLPDLVPPGDVMNALALSSAQFNLGRVIGPALGAIIMSAWSYQAAFYLNAASFAIVVVAVWLARPEYVSPGRLERDKPLDHILEGLRYVARHGWMVAALATVAVASFFGFSIMVLFPGVASDILLRSSDARTAYTVLLTCVGVGSVAGAPLVTYLSRFFKEKEIMKGSMLGLGVLLVCFSLSRTYWLSALLASLIGCCFLMLGSVVNTVLQARSEHNMRGRAVSLYIMVYLGFFPLGGQLLASIADAWNLQGSLLLAGIFCSATAVFLVAFPALTTGADSSLGEVVD